MVNIMIKVKTIRPLSRLLDNGQAAITVVMDPNTVKTAVTKTEYSIE